jgi:hypothetical protein
MARGVEGLSRDQRFIHESVRRERDARNALTREVRLL